LGMWIVTHETTTPETTTVPVALPQGTRGPYTLRIVNGLPDGTARATSAQVWINAQEILGPANFGNNVAAIERQVVLAAENQLSVRFAGQPSTQMLILIQDAQ